MPDGVVGCCSVRDSALYSLPRALEIVAGNRNGRRPSPAASQEELARCDRSATFSGCFDVQADLLEARAVLHRYLCATESARGSSSACATTRPARLTVMHGSKQMENRSSKRTTRVRCNLPFPSNDQRGSQLFPSKKTRLRSVLSPLLKLSFRLRHCYGRASTLKKNLKLPVC